MRTGAALSATILVGCATVAPPPSAAEVARIWNAKPGVGGREVASVADLDCRRVGRDVSVPRRYVSPHRCSFTAVTRSADGNEVRQVVDGWYVGRDRATDSYRSVF